MAKWMKKPVIVEAEVYKPGMEDGFKCGDMPGLYCPKGYCIVPDCNEKPKECALRMPIIRTLEGDHIVTPGDYIITGVKGERYPCKPEIFHLTYEPAEPEPKNTYNGEIKCPACKGTYCHSWNSVKARRECMRKDYEYFEGVR